MQYMAYAEGDGDYKFNQAAPGVNPAGLDQAVLSYIKESNRQIKIHPGDSGGKPDINSENSDSDHYEVRWYIMKPVNGSGWHVDGVLVANTEEIELIKTFSGLQEDESARIMESLNIDAKLGASAQTYLNIPADSVTGQYIYHQKDPNIQSYRWTLHAIADEIYHLQEKDYGLSDRDCATITVVRTKDGNYHETIGDSTDGIQNVNSYLVGGKAQSVSFNNFYTQKNTGILNIAKRDGTIELSNPAGKLKNAAFRLQKSDGSYTKDLKTNVNGAAVFFDLTAGSYTLTEVQPPDGYTAKDGKTQWNVEVAVEANEEGWLTKNRTTTIRVAIEGTTVYEAVRKENKPLWGDWSETSFTVNTMGSYIIDNVPSPGTLTITKQFENISLGALNELKAATGEDAYRIVVENADKTVSHELKLSDADSGSTDGKIFNWRLPGLAEGVYTVTESGFRHVSAKDTVVEVETGGQAASSNIKPEIDYGAQTAVFSIEIKDQTTNRIQIRNNYTDRFTLKAVKQGETSAELLEGAEFEVYGAYDEANISNKWITYPYEGTQKRAYYIGTVTTGADGSGTAVWNGNPVALKLSAIGENYTYVLSESKAPPGYQRLSEPIIIGEVGPGRENTVSGGRAVGNYDNGVFEVQIPNQTVAPIEVRADLLWEMTPPAGTGVVLELYRRTPGGLPEKVEGASATLDGDIDLMETESWKCVWRDLPSCDDTGEAYLYYVREGPVDGFHISYSEGTEKDSAGQILGKTGPRDGTGVWGLTIVHEKGYCLPETGGGGIDSYLIGGSGMVLAAVLLWAQEKIISRFYGIDDKKIKRKEGKNETGKTDSKHDAGVGADVCPWDAGTGRR